ncbi:hypothetical protein Tco_0911214 [Tanacetum coccineum]|uniref:Uncharacterized protein n=1 Tax=Tanacetum coccineum TaxID=301880 RepID=A0ABQ5D289_9ASTR
MIEEEVESDTDSEDITEAEKKFKQRARDEEVARKVQEDWEVEEVKKSDDSFIAIGSVEDEKVIKEMNEQVADASKKRVKKDDSIKGEIKEEEGTRKRKLEWRSEYFTTKPQYDETEEIEDVYLNVVIRSNRQRRYFSTLMAVLSILDRDDICAIYQLIVSWKLHSSSGIHTIKTDEGIVIHMLVENKYPLKKEVLSQLLKLKLEIEEDSTMALELIRFVKKQIAELEPEDL